MDHENILLIGSIVLHEKENWNLQASFMVVINHHLEILTMDGEASDLEKNGDEELGVFSIVTMELGWPRKPWRLLTTIVEYKNPHKPSIVFKGSCMMNL